jgi:hypothetical protein
MRKFSESSDFKVESVNDRVSHIVVAGAILLSSMRIPQPKVEITAYNNGICNWMGT